MRFRYQTGKDKKHPEIVAALRAVGCSVQGVDHIPGAPDLLVGYRGTNWLLEIKAPLGPRGGGAGKRAHSGQALNEAQEKWHKGWRGQVATIHTVEDAFELLGIRVTTLAGQPLAHTTSYRVPPDLVGIKREGTK